MKIQNSNTKRKGAAPTGKYTSQFPLLVKKAIENGFEIPTFQPRGSDVVVWRLPPIKTTLGGIHIVEDFESPHVKGILIAWGPKAMDSLWSEGYDLGQTVIFKRFAGWETNDQTPETHRACKILMLNASDISGSDEIRHMLESGKATYIRGEDGRHHLSVKQISDKKAKVLALAAHPSASPGEKAAAQKIAASMK